MNMALNISEIMENENVLGCNLNIEQLGRIPPKNKLSDFFATKYEYLLLH